MALAAGSRLGSYEIVGAIGSGGMGEVYRARDTKLGRDIAVKVLPPSLTSDPERLARFQREAQVLASLNHPNIAAIYHVEEADGAPAIVMELVEGDTLADRIARGPIPIDEALPIAKQIAEALEAAHEQGVIHRDLKPANIKVRTDGTVKVLDFGLALAETSAPAAAGQSPLSMSPTITSPALMTDVGVILGTAAYMSPEQAKGRPADKRSDIWAFGCVLFEMLNGKRAFEGNDVAEVLAFVLTKEPNWTELPPHTPPAIRTLLKRCLEKKCAQRVNAISTARFVIEEQGNLGLRAEPQIASRSNARKVVLASAVLLIAAIGVAAVFWWSARSEPKPLIRTEISASGANALRLSGYDPDVAITPDGLQIVYRGQNALIVRGVDQLAPRVLSGLNTPQGVFMSPDGQWVGFFDGTRALKKVAITGGPPVTLASINGGPAGATWGDDGTIVYSAAGGPGLQRVSANGGDPTTLARPDRAELAYGWPEFLPNNRGVLFSILPSSSDPDAAQIAVLDLRTNTKHVLARGYDAHYVAGGYLVYGAENSVRAARFDLDRLAITGPSVPIPDGILITSIRALDMAVAANGTLAYVPGTLQTTGTRTLAWVDRDTHQEQPIPGPPRAYLYPRLSPDGTRVALTSQDQQQDLWIWNLLRMTLTRLTFDSAVEQTPNWTPDGRNLVFSSGRAGRNIFEIDADGTGAPKRLTESSLNQTPTSITPDGKHVILNQGAIRSTSGQPGTGGTIEGSRDISVLHLFPKPTIEPLLTTRFEERGGVVSPDSRYLAYESDSSGRFEIYVRPFPAVDGGQWQVSTAGGVQPLWSSDGRELFYLAPDGSLMSVAVTAHNSSWSVGSPTKLFSGNYFTGGTGNITRQYDVTKDGRRFLIIKEDESAAPQNLVFVQNWGEELKRLVPTK